MQGITKTCMSCNKVFYKMPALFVVNQKVKYGLHVLHEIWNFFYFQETLKSGISLFMQSSIQTIRGISGLPLYNLPYEA